MFLVDSQWMGSAQAKLAKTRSEQMIEEIDFMFLYLLDLVKEVG